MLRTLRLACVLFAWTVTLLGSGCARQTGSHAELIFMYESPSDPFNFNKPVGVGHKLEMFVHSLADDSPVLIEEAASTNPKVMRVTGSFAHLFEVEALEPGETTLRVRAVDEDGREYVDEVKLRVAEMSRVEFFGPACETWRFDERGPVHLANTSNVFVPWERFAPNGEFITGFGKFPVSVDSDRGGAIRDNRINQDGVFVDLGGKSLTLRSTLNDAHVDFRVVHPRRIDGVWMDEWDRSTWTMVGRSSFVFPEPDVRGRPVCQHELEVVARSLTPEICEVSSWDPEVIQIEGRAFGLCRYELAYPRGGRGARGVFTARVGSLPSFDGDQDHEPESVPWWLAPLLALLTPLVTAPLLWARRGPSRRGRAQASATIPPG